MTDKGAVERNRRARERVRGSGGRVVQVNLSAAPARALARLEQVMTGREAIERALLAYSPPDLEAAPADWLDAAERARDGAAG